MDFSISKKDKFLIVITFVIVQLAMCCIVVVAAAVVRDYPFTEFREDAINVEEKAFYGNAVTELGVDVGEPLELGTVGVGFNNAFGYSARGQHAAGGSQNAGGFDCNLAGGDANVFSDKQTLGFRETFDYSNNAGHAIGGGYRAQGGRYNQGVGGIHREALAVLMAKKSFRALLNKA